LGRSAAGRPQVVYIYMPTPLRICLAVSSAQCVSLNASTQLIHLMLMLLPRRDYCMMSLVRVNGAVLCTASKAAGVTVHADGLQNTSMEATVHQKSKIRRGTCMGGVVHVLAALVTCG
jgi:hypothetical protein